MTVVCCIQISEQLKTEQVWSVCLSALQIHSKFTPVALCCVAESVDFESWRSDLNPQPSDYKSDALPLCYASKFCQFLDL